MHKIRISYFATLMTPVALIMAVGYPLRASGIDSRIVSSAENSYNFKTYLKDDSIKVASSGGVVTLTGTVSEDFHKTLAQQTVAELAGVKSVNNQLTVTGDQVAEKSDGWLTMKVKTALTFHKNVSASGTNVSTQNGIVTLTGNADSEAQKQLTTEYAKDVEGVTEVRNEMVVPTTPKPAVRTIGEKVDDASITAQIKASLLFHKSTHTLATKVTTREGTVTLRGEAQNAAERDLVTKLAEDINGVKHVNNKMTVQDL